MMRARAPTFSQTRTFSPASKHSSRTIVDWTTASTVLGLVKDTATIGNELHNHFKTSNWTPSAKIYSKLTKEPFSPPQPAWGILFDRPAFKDKLLRSVENGLYHVYYGPSSMGKTVAVKAALQGKAGVAYVSMRNVPDSNVFFRFAEQVGFFDRDEPVQVGLDLLSRFGEAVELFKQKSDSRVLLVVDDIHGVMEDGKLGPNAKLLCASLVDLYNAGQLSVLYMVSDYAAIETLKAVSGHSYRLSSSLFPRIPDNEMVVHIEKCAVYQKREYYAKHQALISTPMEKFLKTIGWHQETTGILTPHDEAKSIVLKLDSHLGDVIKCLKMVLENRMTVDEAVDSLVRDAVPLLRPALIGDLNTVGDIDVKTFVVTANFLFEKLSEVPDKEMKWTSILNTHKELVQNEAKKVVNKLVAQNLLSFVDDITVKIHSRRLHSAYVDVLKHDEDVIRALKTHDSKPQAPETKN